MTETTQQQERAGGAGVLLGAVEKAVRGLLRERQAWDEAPGLYVLHRRPEGRTGLLVTEAQIPVGAWESRHPADVVHAAAYMARVTGSLSGIGIGGRLRDPVAVAFRYEGWKVSSQMAGAAGEWTRRRAVGGSVPGQIRDVPGRVEERLAHALTLGTAARVFFGSAERLSDDSAGIERVTMARSGDRFTGRVPDAVREFAEAVIIASSGR